MVTVEQGWPFCGIGAEISAQVTETDTFDHLDAPVFRVTGVDVPMPYETSLEKASLPSTDDIIRMCKKSLHIHLHH